MGSQASDREAENSFTEIGVVASHNIVLTCNNVSAIVPTIVISTSGKANILRRHRQ
jgi:hypothetical protein